MTKPPRRHPTEALSTAHTVNWVEVSVHAAFGVIVGALAGLSLWSEFGNTESMRHAIPWVVGGAVAFGILSGFFLDCFWKKLVGVWRGLWS